MLKNKNVLTSVGKNVKLMVKNGIRTPRLPNRGGTRRV